MLQVICEEYLEKVKEFAREAGMEEQLQSQLDYLDSYSDPNRDGNTICQLRKDFAPYSFAFTMQRKQGAELVNWFPGGLIFHGAHDNGGDGGAPTFSVNLTPCNGWVVHT